MIDVTTERLPDLAGCGAWRRTAASALAEAAHRVEMTPGAGLQSAVDHARALAAVLVQLCKVYSLGGRDG